MGKRQRRRNRQHGKKNTQRKRVRRYLFPSEQQALLTAGST